MLISRGSIPAGAVALELALVLPRCAAQVLDADYCVKLCDFGKTQVWRPTVE